MIDFAAIELPTSPNTYLVCFEEACPTAAAHRPSPIFEAPAPQVKDAWFTVMDAQKRLRLTDEDPAALQYEFVQRSAIFRFPDTITVKFVPLDDAQSTVLVYSRSKYGHSDLGVNKKRVDAWLAAVEAELARPAEQPSAP